MIERLKIRSKNQRTNEHARLNPHAAPIRAVIISIICYNTAFVGLLCFSDYIVNDPIPSWFFMSKPGDFLGSLWWLYVYIPITLFFSGVVEIAPYVRLLRVRRAQDDASILIWPPLLIRRGNDIGFVLLIFGFIATSLAKDRMVSHCFILAFWLCYMFTNTALNKRNAQH